MNESEMAQSMIDWYSDQREGDFDIELEKHYNHYGTRGVVDIVDVDREPWLPSDRPRLNIYELKSKPAIEVASGANEIVRQFNRHQEYFFKGQNDYPPYRKYSTITFYLVFNACEAVIEHLQENLTLYQQAADPEHGTSHIALFHEDYGVMIIPEGVDTVQSATEGVQKICEVVMS